LNTQLLYTLFLGGCFLALFGLAELLYHFGRVKAEYTRKLVHAGTGLLTLLFPICFESHWYVLALCTSFAVLLSLSLKFGWLRSINAIDRKSHGSISYPVSVYAAFLFYEFIGHHQPAFYFVPILLLAICDPIAALLGRKFPWKPFKVGEGKKTVTGSLAFFITAFALCGGILCFTQHDMSFKNLLLISFLTSAATAIAEAFSSKGFDNLTIPAAAMLVIYLVN
jgi:phytol kinase